MLAKLKEVNAFLSTHPNAFTPLGLTALLDAGFNRRDYGKEGVMPYPQGGRGYLYIHQSGHTKIMLSIISNEHVLTSGPMNFMAVVDGITVQSADRVYYPLLVDDLPESITAMVDSLLNVIMGV